MSGRVPGAAAGLLVGSILALALWQWHRVLGDAPWSWLAPAVLLGAFGAALGSHVAGLRERASTDPGTGLANRRHLKERLAREWERSRRYDRPLSLIFIDVDDFKRVNDRFGHLEGDRLLREVGEALVRSVRRADLVARWGGEEFALLLPETDGEHAQLAARRIVEQVRKVVAGDGSPISISVGVASYPGPATSLEEFLAEADAAMYAHKASKRRPVGNPAGEAT